MANKPNSPKKWAAAKAKARRKFKVYPCVPEDSLCVTHTGLASVEDIQIGTEILAYDPDLGECIWSPVENIHRHKNAPLMKIGKATGFSVKCTPDHTWLVEKRNETGPYLSKVKTRDLNSHMMIKWSPDRPMNGQYGGIHQWLKTDSWVFGVLHMSRSEREVWLASAIVYDGCQQKVKDLNKGRCTFSFTQKNEDHFWATVFAAFLNGYHVSTYQKTPTIKGATIIRGKEGHNTQNLLKSYEDPADVWCPQVETGFWIMVQNGQICITGNSAYANGWAVQEYKRMGGTWRSAGSSTKRRSNKRKPRKGKR